MLHTHTQTHTHTPKHKYKQTKEPHDTGQTFYPTNPPTFDMLLKSVLKSQWLVCMPSSVPQSALSFDHTICLCVLHDSYNSRNFPIGQCLVVVLRDAYKVLF